MDLYCHVTFCLTYTRKTLK